MQWTFPVAPCGQIKGINDEGIEQFKSTLIKSLAREICQNSLDARKNDALPVRIEFSCFEAPFPGKEEFVHQLEKMEKYWGARQKNDKKSILFLSNGQSILRENIKIPFLRISDFNTSGLMGIGEPGSPWDNLVKSVGASDKRGNDGGSRGIGKAAAFACSSLRTVFYATKNSEEEKGRQEALQGVARLPGYETGKDTEIMLGTSFWGEGGCREARQYESLDSSFTRADGDTGTDIFVSAFYDMNGSQQKNFIDWKKEMIKCAIDGFFYAIFENKISLNIDGEELSSNTLQRFIDNNDYDFPENADQYYKVLTSNSGNSKLFTKTLEVPGLNGKTGELKLHLMVDPSLTTRRIAMVRNTGMKIYDQGHINTSIQFAGVLVVEGEELNTYLKSMEDATHTEWKPGNTENRSQAERFLHEIRSFCKDSLKSMVSVNEDECIDSGLGAILPINIPNDNSRNDVESIDPVYEKIHEDGPKKRKHRTQFVREALEEYDDSPNDGDSVQVPDQFGNESSGSSNQGLNSGANGGRHDDMLGDDPGDAKAREVYPKKRISFSKFKIVCQDPRKGKYRIVIVPSASSQEGVLALNMITGTNDQVPPCIYDVKNITSSVTPVIEMNKIGKLSFEKDKKMVLDITMDYKDYCSMEGEAYAFEK